MVFCNNVSKKEEIYSSKVTILILIDGFLQLNRESITLYEGDVTILILIDGFLQYRLDKVTTYLKNSHNPYFNRWFSAIGVKMFEKYRLIKSQSLF